MLRTRLTLTFAVLMVLTGLQGAFIFWANAVARYHAERTALTTAQLVDYLALGGNKQRLKVWFAQSVLTGDEAIDIRNDWLARMDASLLALATRQAEALRLNVNAPVFSRVEPLPDDTATISSLRRNFEAMRGAVIAQTAQSAIDPAQAWRAMIEIFDRSDGRDMRVVLADVYARQRAANHTAQVAMQSALTRLDLAAIVLTLTVIVGSALALLYFVWRLAGPFHRVVATTTRLASGDYASAPVSADRDEWGTIERALDDMRKMLATARAKDVAVREGLEAAVAERTRDLTRNMDKLADIDLRRRQFFADISHELRTPITVIKGEAEIALRGANKAADYYRDALQRIASASTALGGRAEELLQLATADVDESQGSRVPVLASAWIHAALARVEPIASHHRILLSANPIAADSSLATATLLADPERLTQALVVILDNAIRYSNAESRVALVAALAPDPDHATSLVVDVIDAGIGIPPEDLERLFERHFRGVEARRRRADGAGLGLAIARKFIEATGGTLTLQASPPRGTRARIVLPLEAT
jgi:two-component system, OmpR family, sensor kinase